ncbi:aldo/keto reductase [Nakamurella sp. GG22]
MTGLQLSPPGAGLAPTVTLRGGAVMPAVGLGLYLIDAPQMPAVVHAAVESGYRLFDTASLYANEEALGRAVATCGVPRSDLFLTSKLWNSDQGRTAARQALSLTLDRLGTDYLDLYLIHWPAADLGLFLPTWETLLELQQQGAVGAVGVANFDADHIETLLKATGVAPAVNQIELHPHLAQPGLVPFNTAAGIITQAWSPLARGGAVLTDPVITRIAAEHDRTPGQVILRWHLQRGVTVVPKTTSPQRMRENLDLFSFALTEGQLQEITDLDIQARSGPDPRTFAATEHPSTS